jgi:hypothetical protein
MESEQPRLDKHQAASAIRLHIDRLVLHGFAHADRHRIAGHVRNELARLMVDDPALASLREPLTIERANAGSIRIRPGATPRVTGTLIAKAIHQSLSSGAASSLAPSPTKAVPSTTTGIGIGGRGR